MSDQNFSGEDPDLVFYFLTLVVEGSSTLGMNKGKLIVCLPHLVTENGSQQFRPTSSHRSSGGLVCCPNNIQYLLRTYATEQVIRESFEHLNELLQASNEDESYLPLPEIHSIVSIFFFANTHMSTGSSPRPIKKDVNLPRTFVDEVSRPG